MKYFRFEEYKVLLYRVLLVYLFYTITRLLFVLFNNELLHVESTSQLIKLCFYGLKFDTTSILYLNAIFIILSLIPVKATLSKSYQKYLLYLYFILNSIGISLNFVDLIYYKFTFSRSSVNILESIENEQNKALLFGNFIINYWYVFILFIGVIFLWIKLYNKVSIQRVSYEINKKYYAYSFIVFLIAIVFSIAGIRGDFDKSTRPINIVDANNYVDNISHANVVLNTPFCIIRTISKKSFKRMNLVSQRIIDNEIIPIKNYGQTDKDFKMKKMNVVVIILESFSREYLGAFNKRNHIDNYVSYTPFLDSLATKSFIFDNAYTNGLKSIHAMPSILAGIPSFKDAFTSSPFLNTEIESIVSTLNSEGYDTSFFHGAPNGSMGFLGFSNILGYDNYYGMTEYNNDDDFDGVWGIWDEKFFRFMKTKLSEKKEPFFATVFSVSSHEPFQIPQEYKEKFKEGDVPLHKCIKYTDYSLKTFFKESSNEDWFNNTLFVITADHCNQIYYDEYTKTLNRTAIPILFYSPKMDNLKGVDSDWAQHIDIYPSILDVLGYEKPFRSWGRSLFDKEEIKPFVINYLNNQYQFMQGDYILTFDGVKATGLFYKDDKNYSKNLKDFKKKEFAEMTIFCKAFIQNYFNNIIDRNLISETN